ncbi:PREDICTED: nuclear receptor-interacting protein 3-like [Branchiostoma belcheri]|uniref:Nuclear receptor-interacting protein 3-like n=1 Tax=Branchiostoma belcheri TaxID=7741 RepID=A0A6P4ZYW7_BRABE|nr:PREDICTED: nuclear receptor-interacting protein 3-like [Branchiostoma belcheri]
MSFKYDREDIREAALKRQQKRLGHHGHGGFVHRDSSDLLPIDDLKKMGTVSKETFRIDDLKKMGTVSKETQPKAIVQQKALKETFKRSDSKEQPGQRNRSMSQDATGTDALTVPSRPRTGRRHHSCSDYDNSDSRLGGDNTLLFIKCKCNDHEVKAVVDTGNIFSVMSEETATTCG